MLTGVKVIAAFRKKVGCFAKCSYCIHRMPIGDDYEAKTCMFDISDKYVFRAVSPKLGRIRGYLRASLDVSIILLRRSVGWAWWKRLGVLLGVDSCRPDG